MGAPSKWANFQAYFAVSGQERALLFRSLAVMFHAGVSLDRSLAMLGEQQPSPTLRKACFDLANKVQSGRYLSNAMSQSPWVFNTMHVRLIAVGEKTGQLAAVLSQLADLEERQLEIQLKVRTSLTVPVMVSSLCVLMVAVAPPLLFRGLFEMLKDTGAAMPWPTLLLITLSDAIRHPLFYLLLVLALGVGAAALRHVLHSPALKLVWLRRVHGLPLVGPTMRLISLTRFAQTLSVMNHVGVPIVQSLEYSCQSTNDPALIDVIQGVIERVKEGDMIGQAMLESGGFPSTFCQAIVAGEESGSLGDMLNSMSRLYQVELEHSLEIMTRSLEPIMLGVVGCIVAFTVVATLLPMLKVMESL
ncbi:type II secretion system F family protein [bacterium]|nr:type II secretion system F family protein [bacterium]